MLKVLKSGFYTTIQDAGRFGSRAYGVPVSGVMDSYSSSFANSLLGNPSNAAVLEMTMTGGVFQFLESTVIVVSGAIMRLTLNDKSINCNAVISIQPNDILCFGQFSTGFRAYLAIYGGFITESVLNSRSMYKSITKAHKISTNDILNYKSYSKTIHTNASVKYNTNTIDSSVLEVFKGPEFNKLPKSLQEHLINSTYNISKLNNRMAYQLEPTFNNALNSIITAPVLPGTVQLTPSGKLIVLMRDCQTTGGYPRVLQLTEKSINILSQKTTGNIINIRLKEF